MSVHSSLRATTSLASQTKSLSNQFRKSCSVKASTTTTGRIDATTTALHGKSGRKCMLTGKRANNGYTVSFSHIRNKKMQRANLQVRLRAWFWSRCWLRRASFGRRIRLFLSPLNFIEFIQPSRPVGEDLTADQRFSLHLFPHRCSTNASTGRNKSDTFACAFQPKRLKL